MKDKEKAKCNVPCADEWQYNVTNFCCHKIPDQFFGNKDHAEMTLSELREENPDCEFLLSNKYEKYDEAKVGKMKSKEKIKLLEELTLSVEMAKPEVIFVDERHHYDEIVDQLKNWIENVKEFGEERDNKKRCDSCDEAAK
jgi:hypothetical protein